MIRIIAVSLIFAGLINCTGRKGYNDGYIQYGPVQFSAEEKQSIQHSMKHFHERYDPREQMVIRKLTGWNYHTDALSGDYHHVRNSIIYALNLLDYGGEEYEERAHGIIRKVISLQERNPDSRYRGVFPYYLEEPVATKKSPVDQNWADFIGKRLVEIWARHSHELPDDLKEEIRQSLILACGLIERRNVRISYTNIAIMGTYVTYMTSRIFDLPGLFEYAENRLERLYDFTLDNGGHPEYNSPTYTVVALDDLARMKQHIIEPEAAMMIDSLYTLAWDMFARHWHAPTGQWAGPHMRNRSTFLRDETCSILYEATGGQYMVRGITADDDVTVNHQLPEHLLHYFTSPEYPRVEAERFVKREPRIYGMSYLAEDFTLGTVNQSSLSYIRHPFIAYWGTAQHPRYFRLRFMHNLYDFSSAYLYCSQHENRVLAGINFIHDGGARHLSIDTPPDGTFLTSDLRIRFHFGGVALEEMPGLSSLTDDSISFQVGDMPFNIHLLDVKFRDFNGYWETGGNDEGAWIDYVLYTGETFGLNFKSMPEVYLGLSFSMGKTHEEITPALNKEDGLFKARWGDIRLEFPMGVGKKTMNL